MRKGGTPAQWLGRGATRRPAISIAARQDALAGEGRRVRVELVLAKVIKADRVADMVNLVIDQCRFVPC